MSEQEISEVKIKVFDIHPVLAATYRKLRRKVGFGRYESVLICLGMVLAEPSLGSISVGSDIVALVKR